MALPDPVVFLVDVDNTLLDNDRIQEDLKRHLEREFGAACRERYWAILEELFAELSAKAAARTPGSGTVAALERGVHAIGKKVVEEAAEAWMAAEHEGPERAAEEISQLLYQTQVLMLASGLELKDVYRHL